jgi:hypothetical protein
VHFWLPQKGTMYNLSKQMRPSVGSSHPRSIYQAATSVVRLSHRKTATRLSLCTLYKRKRARNELNSRKSQRNYNLFTSQVNWAVSICSCNFCLWCLGENEGKTVTQPSPPAPRWSADTRIRKLAPQSRRRPTADFVLLGHWFAVEIKSRAPAACTFRQRHRPPGDSI